MKYVCPQCYGKGRVEIDLQMLEIKKMAFECLKKGMSIRESVNFIVRKYE